VNIDRETLAYMGIRNHLHKNACIPNCKKSNEIPIQSFKEALLLFLTERKPFVNDGYFFNRKKGECPYVSIYSCSYILCARLLFFI
jgi:hypothetical protein